MALKIEQDHNRFRQIVRGKIKADLKKYISHEELIGRKGKDLISIPIPQIDIPTFRFSPRSQGGVGQGDGETGIQAGTILRDPISDAVQESGGGKYSRLRFRAVVFALEQPSSKLNMMGGVTMRHLFHCSKETLPGCPLPGQIFGPDFLVSAGFTLA